jgi:general secretion pathway protein D
MSLVVNQTSAVHEEVANLLAALRRLQDVEAALELRVVTATPGVFERACKEMNLVRKHERDQLEAIGARTVAPAGKRWTVLLDNDQVKKLLETLQGDPATNVLQAPKLTLFSGQIAAIQATEDRHYLTEIALATHAETETFYFNPTQVACTTGLSVGVQSDIAADRRSARVKIKGAWCEPAGPTALIPVQVAVPVTDDQGKAKMNAEGRVETAPFRMYLQKPTFAQVRLDEELELADGGSALVSCGVVPVETPRRDLIAWAERLWSGSDTTTSAERHVFVLVTSRVIVNEEHETPAGATNIR